MNIKTDNFLPEHVFQNILEGEDWHLKLHISIIKPDPLYYFFGLDLPVCTQCPYSGTIKVTLLQSDNRFSI